MELEQGWKDDWKQRNKGNAFPGNRNKIWIENSKALGAQAPGQGFPRPGQACQTSLLGKGSVNLSILVSLGSPDRLVIGSDGSRRRALHVDHEETARMKAIPEAFGPGRFTLSEARNSQVSPKGQVHKE